MIIFGEILIWVAFFGLSDLICDYFHFNTHKSKLLYYLVCFLLGYSMYYVTNHPFESVRTSAV